MHRDIPWSNVMKSRDGSWFLIDFLHAVLSRADNSSGKHLNCENHAPEMFVKKSTHSTAVDIWSVGLLLEECSDMWDDGGERTAFKPTPKVALQRLNQLWQKSRNCGTHYW